jgi:hypothetical protein
VDCVIRTTLASPDAQEQDITIFKSALMNPYSANMKTRLLIYLALFTSLACSLPAAFQLLPHSLIGKPGLPSFSTEPRQDFGHNGQAPFPMAGDTKAGGSSSNGHDSPLIVSDILSKTRSISTFASLARGIESVSARLNDKSKNTTILAPLNSAIQTLPRKPWEDPRDYEAFGQQEAYAGQAGEDRAQRNLRKFVEAHVVPESPWESETAVLGGRKLSWKREDDGKIYVSSRFSSLFFHKV